MLPAHVVDKLTPDMRNVHDTILMKEKLLLKERNPSYPIVIAKVPTGFGFVNTYPADLMFIRYEDIFRLLHMQQLDRNLVRLVSLSMAHDIAMENTAHIAIMDPFYMTPATTQNEQAFLAKYIKDFLVLNKDKKCFVIPYFRELKYCTLLLFHPYHSHVTYLDSGLDKEKDFTDVKSTLDKALSGFIAEIGVDKLRHEKKVKGCHVCNHITKFPCLKQSADDNGMEAWFAILQMRAVVRSQNDLLLPSGLQGNFVNMSDTTDENMTYYVVYHGRVPGVYEDWEDCRRQVHRFSGNSYKGHAQVLSVGSCSRNSPREVPLYTRPPPQHTFAAPQQQGSPAYVVYKVGGDPGDYQFLYDPPKEIPHGYVCTYVPDCNNRMTQRSRKDCHEEESLEQKCLEQS
ncbi:hypothetical protein QYE76_033345 [Lolium multiflorum]|uniref:Ribonuclease H1 N-terminal domain-containing protein n=1 Tax=Lolium multiflorum TaxID=4521 RepID=A0AAD8QX97_LOLMU|nr:hypothetical protein QYE76_033345 [Lolium multiflorum]